MDQIIINGEEWVRLNDVCDILRTVKNPAMFENTDKVINQIAQLMFYDKVKAAKTKEEREAARELPGDFVVCKKLGYTNPNGEKLIFFMEFSDGEAKAIDNGEKAMRFKYQSKADEVAETLGEGWKSVSVGIEDGRIVRRALSKFFEEADEE